MPIAPGWASVGRGEESRAGFGALRCRWRRDGRRSLLASRTALGGPRAPSWHALPEGMGPSPGMGLIQPTAGLVETNVTRAAIREGARPRCHGHDSWSWAGGQREADPGTDAPQLIPPPDDRPLPKEVISGLKTHLDPRPHFLPQPPYPPAEGAEGPAPVPALQGGGQGAHEQPVLDNPG